MKYKKFIRNFLNYNKSKKKVIKNAKNKKNS